MSKLFHSISYLENLQPHLRTSDETLALRDFSGSISFDTSQRYCIGWHDLATKETYPCPEQATTDSKYDTCPACQRRTGFNPAFYHATSVSPQQEARNNEPHILYLAYMGEGYLKVGISWAERGIRRLLDQGARSALVLDTFPTALIARQYEASIAALPHLHETTPTRTKLQLLTHTYNEVVAEKALLATKHTIETTLKTTFSGGDPLHLSEHYYDTAPPTSFTTLTTPVISGTALACIGDILCVQHGERTVALALKRYTGYPVTITEKIEPLDLPAEQVSLFG